jgi:hypothetical protein
MNRKSVVRHRVVFCYNRISYVIARELATRDQHIRHIIFYSRDRIIILPTEKRPGLIPIRRWNLFIGVFLAFFFRPDEVLIPHFKINRPINRPIHYIAKRSKKLSLLDDGLDTFRETPKNLAPSAFEKGTAYYTFSYSIPLAHWLSPFALNRVCNLRELAQDNRPPRDLHGIFCLVIESPGIRAESVRELPSSSRLVKHPNRNKITFRDSGVSPFDGEMALERSLPSFDGRLIVGESMVLVFALLMKNRSFQLTIYLERETFENLRPLHDLLKYDENVELILSSE